MNKIIFLDIDGVLNSSNSFDDNHEWRKFFCKFRNESLNDEITYCMINIDLDKVFILRDVCNLTGSKVVISSSYRRLWYYPLIEEKLVNLGLPIVGITPCIRDNRGEEIRSYLQNNKVDNFVILDDEIFPNFYELENYLVKTSFRDDGLTEDIAEEIVRVLRRV